MKPTDDVSRFPENGKSTTPRTDPAVYPMNGVEIVWPHFARQLETELSVMQSEFGKMVLSAAVMGDRNVELRRRAEKAETELAAALLRIKELEDENDNLRMDLREANE